MSTSSGGWKVGEVARRTGLTVRALHHYDAIGLLRPSGLTASGHRLYDANDLARLHRVLALRTLGFSLEEVRGCLDDPGFAPVEVIRRLVARVRERIERERALIDRLERLGRTIEAAGTASAEEFLETMEAMTMFENYYTTEQLEQLKKRGEDLGPEAIRAVEAEWPVLMAKVKAEMEAGTDPVDPKVQALARRWGELVEAFTGGDPGIRESLGRLWKERGSEVASTHGMDYDPRLFEYVGKAQTAAGRTRGAG